MKRISILTLAMVLVLVASAWAQSAEEIITTMDEQQTFDSNYVEGTLITTDSLGEKRSTYNSWSRGSTDFLIEFTNVEERGQKVLRVGDELYLFYPDAEDIIPMHGAALKDSLFGDISYEDITEGRNTLDKYDVKLLGTEQVDGKDCWVIEMNARTRKVPYSKQVIKVDQSNYVLVEGQYFAKSGRLIKTIQISGFEELPGDKVLVTGMVLEDQLRRGSKTEMQMNEYTVNPNLDDDLFSLRSLY